MKLLTAKAHLQTAASRQARNATDTKIKLEDLVLVLQYELEQLKEPYRVTDINKRMVHVDREYCFVQHSLDRCKAYNIEDEVEAIINDQDNAAAVALQEDRRTNLHGEV